MISNHSDLIWRTCFSKEENQTRYTHSEPVGQEQSEYVEVPKFPGSTIIYWVWDRLTQHFTLPLAAGMSVFLVKYLWSLWSKSLSLTVLGHLAASIREHLSRLWRSVHHGWQRTAPWRLNWKMQPVSARKKQLCMLCGQKRNTWKLGWWSKQTGSCYGFTLLLHSVGSELQPLTCRSGAPQRTMCDLQIPWPFWNNVPQASFGANWTLE